MGQRELEITEIRVKLTTEPQSKLRAYCSITFGDAFVVRDLKIIEGGRGSFIAMPSRKICDHCSRCGHKNHLRARYCNQCGGGLDPDRALRHPEGRIRLHADLAHPIHSGCREWLHRAIMTAYELEVERSQQEGYQPTSFDDLDGSDEFNADDYLIDFPRRESAAGEADAAG
ncbi:MAG: septation protein SpoVG family protein [Planctomycetota bacterium]